MDDNDLPWARFGPRCRSTLRSRDAPTVAYFGRCELARGHDGDHALERGNHIVRWSVNATAG